MEEVPFIAWQSSDSAALCEGLQTYRALIQLLCKRVIQRIAKLFQIFFDIFGLIPRINDLLLPRCTLPPNLCVLPCHLCSLLSSSCLSCSFGLLTELLDFCPHVAHHKDDVETAEEANVEHIAEQTPVPKGFCLVRVIEEILGLEQCKC